MSREITRRVPIPMVSRCTTIFTIELLIKRFITRVRRPLDPRMFFIKKRAMHDKRSGINRTPSLLSLSVAKRRHRPPFLCIHRLDQTTNPPVISPAHLYSQPAANCGDAKKQILWIARMGLGLFGDPLLPIDYNELKNLIHGLVQCFHPLHGDVPKP